MNKTIITATAIAAGTILALGAPLAASAHVTVAPNTAQAGSYALVTFKVPNESATAVTNKLEVDLPSDTPFTSVSYVPVQGWSVDLVKEKLPKPVEVHGNEVTDAVTKVIWTAQEGAEVEDGQLQLFPLSLGAVPDTGKIVFKALQTYSDGNVVSWVETTEDAAHPAPVLYVNDAPPAAHGASDSPSVTATPVPGPDDSASAPTDAAGSSDGDVVARSLGIAGLVLGAVGAVLGIVAFRRVSSR